MTTVAECSGVDCSNKADKLQCPTCLKHGISSYFCGQDCFKKSWSSHKAVHKLLDGSLLNNNGENYNPFPSYSFSGSLRPVYPLSDKRSLPDSIKKPDYALDGVPKSEHEFGRSTRIEELSEEEIVKMRKVSKLAREVLDIAAASIKPGITTDEIDEIVHKACIERDSYPSPLNYYNFPKSVCTSVNEVICHGIPDKRKLVDGDIVNIDVTLYHDGYHSDLNETYYVGDKAKCNKDTVRVVETARECLDEAIKIVKPGMRFRSIGDVIEAHAKKNNCSVIRTYCGHGVNSLFHSAPNIPHYAHNKAVGIAKEGVVFTIEPMIALGSCKDKTWPDNWTAVTADGKFTAQFEHTLLVTKTGVEVLTARKNDSPGGPIPRV